MSLESLVQSIGLPGIVLGTMLEGEVIAFIGGTMAHRGFFRPEAVALAATLGAAMADQAVFLFGRYAARSRRVDRLLSRGMTGRLRGAMARHPDRTILSLRFIYGARLVGLLLAGSAGLGWLRFSALNLLSVVIWAHAIVWLGYGAGAAIEQLFGEVPLTGHLLAAGAMAAAVAAFLVLRWRRRHAVAAVPGRVEDGGI